MKDVGTRDGRSAGTRVSVTLLGFLTALLVTGYAVVALPGRPSAPACFSIRATPSSLDGTVRRGRTTSYTVTVRWRDGFSGPVTLTVSGLPAGTTGTFAPANGPRATMTPSSRSATLVVETSRTAPLGRHVLTITGTSGRLTRRTTSALRVLPRRGRSFGLTASPSSVTITAGASATYAVCLTRTRAARPVTLSIGSALPAGVIASFEPNPIRGGCSTLTLTTAWTTRAGTYLLTLDGRGRRRRMETTVTAILALRVTPPRPSPPPPVGGFSISGGALQPMYPGGAASPIDLSFHNENPVTIFVAHVKVSVTGTSAEPSCTATDFTTTDFSYGTAGSSSGSGGVAVPPGQTVSLQGAGVDQRFWPTVAMIDAGDQDACEGASVTLTYTDGLAYST